MEDRLVFSCNDTPSSLACLVLLTVVFRRSSVISVCFSEIQDPFLLHDLRYVIAVSDKVTKVGTCTVIEPSSGNGFLGPM